MREIRLAMSAPTRGVALALCAFALSCEEPPPKTPAASLPAVAENELRPLQAFGAIADPKERSRALFGEMTRVMLHPRCKNCHPAGDSPTQGDDSGKHDPPVFRGPENKGIAALACTTCHQDHNLELSRVPGAPKWALAPREMAWLGQAPSKICVQVKDRARNGNKTLAQLVEHGAHDELVAWAWEPGHGRTSAPGTQAQFAAIMQAWVDTGAECPSAEASR